MRNFKNIISLVFLAGFVFIAPLKTDALTIEEIVKNSNGLQPISITDIKNAISDYENQETIDEINSILDESLSSSKNANDKLVELNTIISSINEDNKALLTIKEKNKYDKSVSTLKDKVELAKQINVAAKNYSQSGLDKYNEALEKYVSLKSKLEDEKEKADAILDSNISKINTKLDIINDLLLELINTENKLKEAYSKANTAYESAKENAKVVNNNFSEKLEELKEYVEVNGEQELNDLIQANVDYLTSGVLYATSQVALKLIDIEIQLVEAEIASLEADLVLLDEQLAPYEEALNNKKNELNILNDELDSLKEILNDNGTVADIESQILSANEVLQDLNNTKNNIEFAQAKCSSYIADLNTAIENNDTTKVVELLLKNEESYGFVGKNIKVTIEKKLNSSFELVNYVFVTDLDTSKEFVYSYEEKDGVVTIYEQNKVAEHEATEINGTFTVGKYIAKFNGNTYNVSSININESLGRFSLNININGFRVNNKYYEVKRENNSWFAVEKNIEFTYGRFNIPNGIQLVDGTKNSITITEAEHYEQGTGNPITSQAAVNRCSALETNTIDTQISVQQEKISALNNKLTVATTLESQISEKETEIAEKETEVVKAETELDNQKAIITNEKGMTYAQIEVKLDELDKKLNHYPKLGDESFVDDLANIADLTALIANLTQGNIDVQALVETINNLNVGLNIKKRFINEIDTILANNYNKAKQDLIDVAGEDLENISNILSDIAPLINEVAESNLKLLETKAKYELAKTNYINLQNTKELALKAQELAKEELDVLEKLKEENNFDLSDLDAKFNQTKDALVNVENEVEVKINDYVIVEDESFENNNDNENDTKNDTTIKEESTINKIKQKNSSNKDADKEQNNKTRGKENTDTKLFDSEEKFNWLNLLWLLPIVLIIFFIIILIKRKKEKED